MREINLNRQLVGIEDLLIGFGTVMQTRGGQQVQVTKLNAGSLPFDETQSLLQWAQTVNLTELGAIVEELTIVANNKDNIVSVSNNSVNINLVAGLNDEISSLYANLTAIQSNYTNITTLIDIHNNMTNLLLIASQIIPNITEILNVDVLATQVANDKTAVETMKLAMETIYDTFDDRFLGSKSTDPIVDNDGNALIDGAMYFNTSSNAMKVYDLGNTLWVTIPQIYLSGLLDVQLISITTGDLLTWNGTKWVNTRTPKVDSIQLNGGNSTEGTLSWNANEGTADLTLPGGSILQLGQEEVRTVRNSTASPIPDGTLVMFDGTIGNSGRVKVKPFTGGFSEAHLLYGMTTQLIAANSDGIINIAGKVRGINTTGALYGETWVDGDILYAKPDDAGALTKVVPADDKLKLRVAAVVHSHTSGTLEIRFTTFNENMYYTKTQSDALKVPINLSSAIDKTTPLDADLIALSDSGSSFSLKKLSWLNLKATIKTYFDTLFVKKIASVDNTVPRFNSNTGELKTSGVIISDDGNVGIGIAPNSWMSTIKALEINDASISSGLGESGAANAYLRTNSYVDSLGQYIYKKTSLAHMYALTSTGHTWLTAVSGTAGDVVPYVQHMKLDSTANLTVGSASMMGQRGISVSSGTLADDEFVYSEASGGLAGVLNRTAYIGVLKHSAIANSCAVFGLHSQAGTNYRIWIDDSGQLRLSTTRTHVGTTSGTVVGTQTSDERVKNVVGICPYGLQEILELETYKYSMKDDVEGSYKLGFVAQQAMGVIPESVYDTGERLTKPVNVTKYKVVQEAVKDEDGNILEPEVTEPYEDIEYQETEDTVTKLAMDYQMMIPVLVNAMKEQQAIIESLKARLDILEGAV